MHVAAVLFIVMPEAHGKCEGTRQPEQDFDEKKSPLPLKEEGAVV